MYGHRYYARAQIQLAQIWAKDRCRIESQAIIDEFRAGIAKAPPRCKDLNGEARAILSTIAKDLRELNYLEGDCLLAEIWNCQGDVTDTSCDFHTYRDFANKLHEMREVLPLRLQTEGLLHKGRAQRYFQDAGALETLEDCANLCRENEQWRVFAAAQIAISEFHIGHTRNAQQARLHIEQAKEKLQELSAADYLVRWCDHVEKQLRRDGERPLTILTKVPRNEHYKKSAERFIATCVLELLRQHKGKSNRLVYESIGMSKGTFYNKYKKIAERLEVKEGEAAIGSVD